MAKVYEAEMSWTQLCDTSPLQKMSLREQDQTWESYNSS